MSFSGCKIMVTGGAGFIGSAVVRRLLQREDATVINVDALTYAANLENLATVEDAPGYYFEQADICNFEKIRQLLETYEPDAIIHLAAESHVDRSIDNPFEFVTTNVNGTCKLLEATRIHLGQRPHADRKNFKFLHVSTDEVFGSLGSEGCFSEATAYRPNSPYSASKAASDHFVRAWHETYGLPILITNCTNNYGPYQFPEKLIPLMISKCLANEDLPVYGNGLNIRDWLYVDDHAEAIILVLAKGIIGREYNIGGECEQTNIEVVNTICDILDELQPLPNKNSRRRNIKFVPDRPGHDLRYAMDISRINQELGWYPKHDFICGLKKTVDWYLNNRAWQERIKSGAYRGERLGLNGKS